MGVPVLIRMPEELVQRIDFYGRNRSEFIRAAVEHYLHHLASESGMTVDAHVKRGVIRVQLTADGVVIAEGTVEPPKSS